MIWKDEYMITIIEGWNMIFSRFALIFVYLVIFQSLIIANFAVHIIKIFDYLNIYYLKVFAVMWLLVREVLSKIYANTFPSGLSVWNQISWLECTYLVKN